MRRALLSLLLAAPLAAQAQVYVDTARSESFVPIASIPGITGLTTINFTNADNGSATIATLPFAFNFFGVDYTRVNVSSNGYVTFGTEGATTQTNTIPGGSTGAPNAWIAPLWDDLVHPVVGNARWGVVGAAPNRRVVIEAGPASRRTATTGTLFYQVWLFEGLEGRFEYRATGDPAFALDATIGYEGAGGRRGLNAPGCAPANGCAVVPTSTTWSTQRARPPELSGSLTLPVRGALPGVPVDLPVNLRNLGVDTATGVLATVYLSTNNVLDAADVIVGTVGPVDVTAVTAGTTTTARVVVPASVAPGDYVVLLDTDSADDWREVDEADNLFFTTARFATAPELRPTSITIRTPVPIVLGDNLGLTIPVQNDGIPVARAIPVELYASVDRVVNANDISLGTVMVTLTGADPQNVLIDVPLPMLPLGGYYPIAVFDPIGAPGEIIPTNNTIVGGTRFFVGADFAVTSVTLPAQLPPGVPASIRTRLDSAGVPYVGPVSYRLYASLDTAIDGTDVVLGEFVVPFNNEDFRDDTQLLTLPTAPGRYYALARIDPADAIAEIDETNNDRASAVGINAPDLSVTAVSFTPTVVAPGATATVTATLRSLGLPLGGVSPGYAMYLSRDATVDAGDVVLRTATVAMPSTTLAVSARVRIPVGTAPGGYRVLVGADPAGAIAELDEVNNVFASTTRLSVPGAELEVLSVTGSSTTVEGQPYAVTLTLANRGVLAATAFRYAYYASNNPLIRLTDTRLLVSGTSSIAAGATRTFVDTVVLPLPTTTTSVYLGVIVDVFGEVPEVSEADNVGRVPYPIEVLVPRPNVVVRALSAQVAAARQLRVVRTIENTGSAAATVERAYYLSTNEAISAADLEIGRATLTLAAGQVDTATETLAVSATIAPGAYHLGLVLDPGEQVAELDETDNATVTPAFDLVDAALVVRTEALPAGRLGVPYRTTVAASGGTTYQWSIASGALPPGLSLDARTGVVSGTPSATGRSTFTLAVESGGARGERMFEVEVVGAELPLAVLTTALPYASAGQPYAATLQALGGVGALRWTGEMLPVGLALSPGGVLSGAVVTSARFTVRVEDALGARADRQLTVMVLPADGGLAVTTTALPVATVGVEYCASAPVLLAAAGGKPPYTWALTGAPPAGLSLSEAGALCGFPARVGVFAVEVRVTDSAPLFVSAPLVLEVRAATGLAVATTGLPAGEVGTAYAATLTAARGTAPYAWALLPDGGSLPPGLTLSEAGALAGTPTLEGVFAFRASVADAEGAFGVQALSIAVTRTPPAATPAPPVEESGCGCSTASNAGDGLMALLLVVGLVVLRRRRAAGR